MYCLLKSVLRSRFLLVFLDSWVYRLSKTCSFVFVLLYSWEFRKVSITRIGQAEQICVGFYRFFVAQPEQNKQFCICFAILFGNPKRHCSRKLALRSRSVQVVTDLWLHSPSKTNSFVFAFVYYCESQEASLRRIGTALQLPHIFKKHMCQPIFEYFVVDIHHRLRPRRGLGRSGLLEGKNAADFYTPFFPRFGQILIHFTLLA